MRVDRRSSQRPDPPRPEFVKAEPLICLGTNSRALDVSDSGCFGTCQICRQREYVRGDGTLFSHRLKS